MFCALYFLLTIHLLYLQLINCHWHRTFEIDNCPSPPQILNAFPLQEVWDEEQFGEMKQAFLSYKCKEGYSHQGDNTIYCVKKKHSFSWTKPTFSCDPIPCLPPNSPKNGHVLGANFTFGQFVTYECEQGYDLYSSDGKIALSTSPMQVCTSNGTWSGETPQCVALLCPIPDSIPNGFAKPTKREVGGELIFRCNPGYTTLGNNNATCSLSGKWEGQMPMCVLKKQPKPIEQKLEATNEVNENKEGYAGRIWKQVKEFFNF